MWRRVVMIGWVGSLAFGQGPSASQPSPAWEATLQAAARGGEPRVELAAILQGVPLLEREGRMREAMALVDRGQVLAERVGDRGAERRLERYRVKILMELGQSVDAAPRARALQAAAEAAGDEPVRIDALIQIGRIAGMQGDFPTGLKALHDAERGALALGDRARQVETASSLMAFYLRAGDVDKAVDLGLRTLPLAQTLPDDSEYAVICMNLGVAHQERGRLVAAAEVLGRAERILERNRSYHLLSSLEVNLADLLLKRGKYREARAQAERGMGAAQRAGDPLQLALCQANRGIARNRLGEHGLGHADLEAALRSAEALQAGEVSIQLRGILAEEYAFAGRMDKAYQAHVDFKARSDARYNSDRARQLQELEAKFQSEKQAREIAELRAAEQRRGLIRTFSLVAVLLSLGLAVALLSRLRAMRRAKAELEDRVRERTQALEQSQEAILRAQRLNLVATVGAGMAHDLNNHLAVVCALAEQEGSRAELLKAAHKAAALARRTMAHAGDPEAHKALFDLGETLAQLRPLLQRLVGHGIRLDLATEGAECWMEADPLAIEQVLVNLATNARDAMEGQGTLRIALTRDRAWARLEVADTGAGMAPEVRERIFDPFYTTKAKGQGTGLGLPSVKAFVEGQGGYVDVESEVGRGTRFILRLPCLGDL